MNLRSSSAQLLTSEILASLQAIDRTAARIRHRHFEIGVESAERCRHLGSPFVSGGNTGGR